MGVVPGEHELGTNPFDRHHEAARLEALGARRVRPDEVHEHGTTWIVMADQEGNEFCVCDSGAGSATQ